MSTFISDKTVVIVYSQLAGSEISSTCFLCGDTLIVYTSVEYCRPLLELDAQQKYRRHLIHQHDALSSYNPFGKAPSAMDDDMFSVLSDPAAAPYDDSLDTEEEGDSWICPFTTDIEGIAWLDNCTDEPVEQEDDVLPASYNSFGDAEVFESFAPACVVSEMCHIKSKHTRGICHSV